MKHKKFNIKDRLKSFSYAMKGVKLLLQNEHNARIHLSVSIMVVLMGMLVNLTAFEWIAIWFSIGIVFITELINTAIEKLADFIEPNQNVQIADIKDIAAAAVLVAAVTAAITGFIIFLPKLVSLIIAL